MMVGVHTLLRGGPDLVCLFGWLSCPLKDRTRRNRPQEDGNASLRV